MTSTETVDAGSVRRPSGRFVLIVVLLALIATGGCSTSKGDDEATSSERPSETTSTTAGTQLAVPLNGTKQAPIHWEMPKSNGSRSPEAVAQLYEATEMWYLTTSDPDRVRPAFRQSATGVVLEEWLDRDADGDYRFYADVQQRSGPVWIKVSRARAGNGDTRVVEACRDVGWLETTDHAEQLPALDRAAWRRFHLRQVTENGRREWRVYEREGFSGLAPPYDTPFQKKCRAWAKHSSPDLNESRN